MLLRRALSNLEDDAIRYAHAGGEIHLRGHRQAPGWRIEVINQGGPVAARHLDKLFDRFYRADDARTSSGNASGLGLSIVKAIMTLHQGEAFVRCTADGEICFSLFFPKAEGRTPPIAFAATLRQRRPGQFFQYFQRRPFRVLHPADRK